MVYFSAGEISDSARVLGLRGSVLLKHTMVTRAKMIRCRCFTKRRGASLPRRSLSAFGTRVTDRFAPTGTLSRNRSFAKKLANPRFVSRSGINGSQNSSPVQNPNGRKGVYSQAARDWASPSLPSKYVGQLA